MATVYRRRYCPDVPLVEVIAEAVAGLVYAASRFEPARGVPFHNYAVMVVHHKLASFAFRWRRWHRIASAPSMDHIRDDSTASADERLDTAQAIEKLAVRLPAKLYSVLRLRYADGLTYREIGERNGYSCQRAAQVVEMAEAMARA
jgi:RNA polymerase sigma factor (sigma-70 family)